MIPGQFYHVFNHANGRENLFSNYTQAFNKVYDRMGSLFIPSMKTELIESDDSFRRVVQYIHSNPVHHGFITDIDNWLHSSYKIFLSNSSTKIEREYVLNIFGGLDKFIEYHTKPVIQRLNG